MNNFLSESINFIVDARGFQMDRITGPAVRSGVCLVDAWIGVAGNRSLTINSAYSPIRSL